MKNIIVFLALFSLIVLASGCLKETPADDAQAPPAPPVELPAETPETPSEEIPTTEQKTVTVNITSEGYNPSSITINSGDTINFVNVNDGPHWVASDPHPIHTDLRGFDARKALQPGESYSFTFAEKGTFGCHDHVDPATRCKIIVQ